MCFFKLLFFKLLSVHNTHCGFKLIYIINIYIVIKTQVEVLENEKLQWEFHTIFSSCMQASTSASIYNSMVAQKNPALYKIIHRK